MAFCDPGATLHQVWVSLTNLEVTIEDTTLPNVTAPTGPLTATDVWQSGTRDVTFSGSDSTGIRELAVFDGAVEVAALGAPGAAAGGCGDAGMGVAYSYTQPCGGSRGVNGSRTIAADTRDFGDGTRTLRVGARDTAGNLRQSSPISVKIDNEAPPVPVPATDQAWSAEADATWTWEIPEETDRAPVTEVQVERCPPSAACVVEELPGGAFGSTVTYTRSVGEGETSVRVRHVDSAGNASAWSAPVAAKRDRSAPASPLISVDETWSGAAGGVVGWTVPDQGSGSPVARAEVEVCGPAGLCEIRPVAAPATTLVLDQLAEGVNVVRVRVVDAAGNAGDWSAARNLRRDRTPPEVAVTAPAGPVKQGTTVAPYVTATDALSGVAAVARQYRIDGGAWVDMGETIVASAAGVYRFRAVAQDAVGNSASAESGDLTVEPGAQDTATPGPTVEPTPTPTAQKATLRLKLRSVRRRGRRIVVKGTVTSAARPERRLAVTIRCGAQRRKAKARVRNDRFVARVRAGNRCLRARAVHVRVTYPGDARLLRATLKRRLRLR